MSPFSTPTFLSVTATLALLLGSGPSHASRYKKPSKTKKAPRARSGSLVLCTACKGEGLYKPPAAGKPVDFKKMFNSKKLPNPLERRVLKAAVSDKRTLIVTPTHKGAKANEQNMAKQGRISTVAAIDGKPIGRYFATEMGPGEFPTLDGTVSRQIFKQIKTMDRLMLGFEAKLPNGLVGRLYRLEGWTGEGIHMSLLGFSLTGKGATPRETHEMRVEGMSSFLDAGALRDFEGTGKIAPTFDQDGVKVWDLPSLQFFEASASSVTVLMEPFKPEIWRHPDFTLVAPAHVSPYLTPWAVGSPQRVRDMTPSDN